MSGAPYIVWSPDGETPPKKSYPTHGEAHQVAWLMAKKVPNRTFYVMARAGKGARVEQPLCVKHADQLAVTNLDGDDLCQLCAETWVAGEGQAARELDAAA